MKAKINLIENSFGLFSAETKRNLVTNSAEYYDLSYEYLNDCLRLDCLSENSMRTLS